MDKQGWILICNSKEPLPIWRSRTITIIEITHAAALREIRLVPGQIANIISYRIITANCSRLPLPTSLHTATPVATRRPRSLCPLTPSLSPPPSLLPMLYQNPLYPSPFFDGTVILDAAIHERPERSLTWSIVDNSHDKIARMKGDQKNLFLYPSFVCIIMSMALYHPRHFINSYERISLF